MALDVKSLEGNELADYTRTAGTEGRWAAAWSVFKGSFWKVVIINVLMLVCFAPLVAAIVLRTMFVNYNGLRFPFNANTGLGYPANPDASGLAENIYLTADAIFCSALIVCAVIAAVGISGGAYSIKKLLNTNGRFSFKDFFHGIKVCYFKVALPIVLFAIFYLGCVLVGDWKDLVIATGGSGGGPITAYVFIIIATVFAGLYCAWYAAAGVSYRTGILKTFKNAFNLLIATPLQTVIFAGIALIPLWITLLGGLMLGGGSLLIFILAGIFLFMIVLFGLSYVLMVWLGYTQWIFDAYIPPKVKAEEKDKKQAQNIEEENDEKSIARALLAAGRSELMCKPILPIGGNTQLKPLNVTFTRADIAGAAKDRNIICGEVEAYENAHKNDPVFAEYNKMFAEREKVVQPQGKKGAKKLSPQNLLNRG